MNLSVSNSDNKRLINPVKKIIMQYKMIEPHDRVAIGISGGKDSSTLLFILSALKKRMPIPFEIVPISLSLGFEGMDITPLEQYAEELGHPLQTEATNIGQVVFDIRQEKNPCSLCANMRRGTLYDVAKSLGCNKVALGHHLDDALETYFMNLVFGGKIGTFQPKTYLDRTDITVIRPLICLEEKQIIQFVATKEIPVIENPCPANKKTKREEIKQLIENISKQYPDIRHKFFNAVQRVDLQDFWNPSFYTEEE